MVFKAFGEDLITENLSFFILDSYNFLEDHNLFLLLKSRYLG
jgi:hypothetical protein